jgi:predicted RNA-binding Zn-ribbon protein involved in translation (DUF1610 family)
MEPLTCISCKKRVTNTEGSASFKCPACGVYDFVRCKHCRELAAKYRCPNCGFEGPN